MAVNGYCEYLQNQIFDKTSELRKVITENWSISKKHCIQEALVIERQKLHKNE